jgi:hypothetical protein
VDWSLAFFGPPAMTQTTARNVGQTWVTQPSMCSLHAPSWGVTCAAKFLSLQFPTALINQRHRQLPSSTSAFDDAPTIGRRVQHPMVAFEPTGRSTTQLRHNATLDEMASIVIN